MMMQRYLWTLDRNDRQTRGGLSTEAELIDVLVAEDLPCIMPPDWLVATMQMDIDGNGIAIHESTAAAGNMWKLELRVVA
ncbi:hypothetical protein [Rhizobium sp. BE258]|uniref:hypothetical protein n=1 Tax=Rhizobium sp. BE258 TaxID=2817722 RepID=UPI002860D967|nr:hypothetical protein [Rhizobium sp. BE258]MDR7145251.1 hypothetical protein [Rhizobium sp. BE258]